MKYNGNISELALHISLWNISAIFRDWPDSLGTHSADEILKVSSITHHALGALLENNLSPCPAIQWKYLNIYIATSLPSCCISSLPQLIFRPPLWRLLPPAVAAGLNLVRGCSPADVKRQDLRSQLRRLERLREGGFGHHERLRDECRRPLPTVDESNLLQIYSPVHTNHSGLYQQSTRITLTISATNSSLLHFPNKYVSYLSIIWVLSVNSGNKAANFLHGYTLSQSSKHQNYCHDWGWKVLGQTHLHACVIRGAFKFDFWPNLGIWTNRLDPPAPIANLS